ncbi:hypothetical protein BB560_002352 [Smittium megazygosporum]|uniref:Adenylyl-sulfate kinase n=1 Tax=Smittium megazygosporum TaxID=133381 RepID=A0A2T9ZF31_9FUNG|nr:hypothetical protein BB560_002350 [Smittium megazygosporum]PVV03183.1 hypothetical protein BB560_002352 [Smittium megazygosporum]
MTGEIKSSNIFWSHSSVSKEERQKVLGTKGATIWFTGLSGSGKSTLATALEKKLFEIGKPSYILDGDNIRFGLNKDLGFSAKDRNENIRRISEVCRLFADASVICLSCFISPYLSDRQQARDMHQQSGLDFIEIYVSTPIETAESRDPKGLYKKARAGIIPEFTGISAPYEAPVNPEISLDTTDLSVEQGVDEIIQYLKKHEII